jgi:ATP-dependent Clp protease adaptor protein ClpS
MAEAEVIHKETTKTKFKEPKRFKVVVLNDDVTPMDFVVSMMMSIFKHSETQAVGLTLEIHNEGSAVAGVYNYEIAEQKGLEATNLARDNGYPLQLKIESE